MFVLGFGIDTNVRQINTVVFNADGRRESRELLDRLKNSDTFHIIRYVENDHDMNDTIISGKARVGIKIPVDYSDRLIHDMSAQVLVLIDGSDSSVAGIAINVTTSIGLDESLRRARRQEVVGRGYAAPVAFQSGFSLAEFLPSRPDRYPAAQRHHISYGLRHCSRKRARDSRAAFCDAGAALRTASRQVASLFRDRLF